MQIMSLIPCTARRRMSSDSLNASAMLSYISGSADPPYQALNFTPLYLAGLWLAVMTMPPGA